MIENLAPRAEGDPVADLTSFALVHRAMLAEVRRLAALMGELGPVGPDRAVAIRDYIGAVCAEVHSHHEREDRILWPYVAASVPGDAVDLAALSAEHGDLDPVLDRIADAAARFAADPGNHRAVLGGELLELSAFLDEHIAAEERELFPAILRYVSAAGYAEADARIRAEIDPAHAGWVLPFTARYATPAEWDRMNTVSGGRVQGLLDATKDAFAATERTVFGGLPRPDVSAVQTPWEPLARELTG
ncbi:hypothetical protein Afil01_64360 [Actinorhabdospora filicis]|uniref:Hemerythrin-like domain-containing protein n=1 Tax=Actinorhabdospora filicis TaxID=1785913 RepID=A0A9W6SRK7_9ACTN|nr:hemerythrin domain-containing protein [Actinorhabdospora filicis]GLZ81629.1 hypothetical protein Afil01_64360 [Actinorhabdospora filicis]